MDTPRTEDSAYAAAEQAIATRISQWGARSHTNPAAEPLALQVQHVSVTGAPRQSSFSQRVLDGKNGDSCERFDVAVTFGGTTDLRAADEGDVRRALNAAMQDSFSTVTLKDGSKLADAIDFSGKKAETEKPQPVIDINTSFTNNQQMNEAHIMIDLPKGVTHSDVVRALAGKQDVKEAQGDATSRVLAGRAANDDQARQAG